jgi:hypothetical protein
MVSVVKVSFFILVSPVAPWAIRYSDFTSPCRPAL